MPQPLNPTSLQPRGHFSQDYQVVLENGVTIDDAEKPEFWAKVCAHPDLHGRVFLRRFDRIQVVPEDGSCFADFVVLAAGVGFAKVKKMQTVEMEDAALALADIPRTTEIVYRGFGKKWCVERLSDGQRLKEGLVSKGEAERASRDYERVTAKAA